MKNHKKIKILLVQITNRNLGDTVIADNARELIKSAFPVKQREDVVIIDYPISCKDLEVLKFVDAIVFAGGGLIKFRNEQHYNHTIAITSKADELNIPVFFNAVGVEGYDESDERCAALKRAINLPCVKGITVRDDTETLEKYYIENKSIVVKSVFDPAVFSTNHFVSAEKRDVIGLGVARVELFTNYGNEKIDRQFLLNFWKSVVTELEKQKEDRKQADEILKKYKKINKLNKIIIDEFIDKIYIGTYDKETKTRDIEIEWNFEF